MIHIGKVSSTELKIKYPDEGVGGGIEQALTVASGFQSKSR